MVTMLLKVACVFLITKVSSLDHDDLVADVENTLNECLGIVADVGWYLAEVNLLQEVNRRAEDENDNDATDVKLGACVSLLKAVDTYRENHSRLELFQDFLRLEERSYLLELLKPLSKKIGDILYVASRDGDQITDFSTACGNQSATLIIVESTNGTVFGGYTDVDWSTMSEWLTSNTAFLFRLRPSFGQFAINTPQYANGIVESNLRFGNDALYIQGNFLSFPTNYVSNSHYDVDGYELNNGERRFIVKEFIALKVEDL